MIQKIDIKNVLSSSPAVTDAPYIYVELSNGTQAKISKDALSTVINDALANKGFATLKTGVTINGTSDFNDYRNMGVYKVYSTTSIANAPTTNFLFGTLLVLSTAYPTQLAINTAGNTYVRVTSNSQWSTWKEL